MTVADLRLGDEVMYRRVPHPSDAFGREVTETIYGFGKAAPWCAKGSRRIYVLSNGLDIEPDLCGLLAVIREGVVIWRRSGVEP